MSNFSPEEDIKFKVGDCFYYRQGGSPHKYKYHIIAVIEEQIVFKWYGKKHQWWHYQIDSEFIVQSMIWQYKELNKHLLGKGQED